MYKEKELSDMTMQELWQLFPIFLTEHNMVWKDWYHEEKQNLKNILIDKDIKKISHIGSTAVSTIWAKPIIDILIEANIDCDLNQIKNVLKNHGYFAMKEEDKRISFNKGYTKKGFTERVFHIHLRYDGDNDEIYFRDYLINNPDIAKEYELLKLDLWKKFEHDRDGYTDSKSDFIKKYTKKAKLETNTF